MANVKHDSVLLLYKQLNATLYCYCKNNHTCDGRCGSSHRRHHATTTHASYGLMMLKPSMRQSAKTTRSTLNVCFPTVVFGPHKLYCFTTSFNDKCFRGECTISQNPAITHIITEPPTYIIVVPPPDPNVPHHARLFSHDPCFITKLPTRTMLLHCGKLNSPSSYVFVRQSLTNAVTYYLTREYDRHRFITPTPSLSRRRCRKLQRTILARTTKRHKCRHLLPYSSL